MSLHVLRINPHSADLFFQSATHLQISNAHSVRIEIFSGVKHSEVFIFSNFINYIFTKCVVYLFVIFIKYNYSLLTIKNISVCYTFRHSKRRLLWSASLNV